jgi:hypothetical protein
MAYQEEHLCEITDRALGSLCTIIAHSRQGLKQVPLLVNAISCIRMLSEQYQ